MTVKRFDAVPSKDMSDVQGVVGVQKQVLIGPADGAPTFAIRRFQIAPGGHTACHRHPFEHGVVVLEGEGEVVTQGAHPLGAGSVVFVPPNEEHQFRNVGQSLFRFLCTVPRHVEE
jgi:quercetin dioxygenase-like cupin family protein